MTGVQTCALPISAERYFLVATRRGAAEISSRPGSGDDLRAGAVGHIFMSNDRIQIAIIRRSRFATHIFRANAPPGTNTEEVRWAGDYRRCRVIYGHGLRARA